MRKAAILARNTIINSGQGPKYVFECYTLSWKGFLQTAKTFIVSSVTEMKVLLYF